MPRTLPPGPGALATDAVYAILQLGNGYGAGLEHFGLSSMRERIEMAGGSFEVHSNLGEGTTITAVLAVR